jgi:hypothetical protein
VRGMGGREEPSGTSHALIARRPPVAQPLTCPCPGCRYEGEFQAGYAHGLGMFTSEGRGEVYVGEFFAGQRHG